MASNTLRNALPDATLFGSIILAFAFDRLFTFTEATTFPATTIGWLLAIGGLSLAVYTLTHLKRKHTSTNAADTPTVLMTRGLYRVSRNPFYLACLCLVAGVAVGLGSWAALAAPVLYFSVIQLIVIPLEESTLQTAFGREYIQYKRSVRRWL